MKNWFNQSFENTKAIFKVANWSVRTFFGIAPWTVVIYWFTQILVANSVVVYTLIFTKVLDRLIEMASTESVSTISDLNDLIYIIVGYFVIYNLAKITNEYTRRKLRFMQTFILDQVMYSKMHKLSIASLENSQNQDLMQRSGEWIGHVFDLVDQFIEVFADIVALIIITGFIALQIPVLLPIGFVLAVIKYIPFRKFNKMDFDFQVDNTGKKRVARKIMNLLTTPADVAEIRINSSFDYLNKKYEDFYNYYLGGLFKIFNKRYITKYFANLTDSIISIVSIILLAGQLIAGSITVGQVYFYLRNIDTLVAKFTNILWTFNYLNDIALKMTNIVDLFDLEEIRVGGRKDIFKQKDSITIELKDLSFRYAGTSKDVIKGLNLTINSDENLAIVGENGAGKTTLIKIIAGVYEPTKGQVLINGIDLAQIDLEYWNDHIGVLFQNFAFYKFLTARENITLGRSKLKRHSQKEIEAAAKKADAHKFIKDMPQKYETIMGEEFEGGIRPSGGQKQKLAIARFFYKNAPLAIFDEPTAAIDAQSEYRIFNNIYKFFRDKTVIIISHRFSTVRNADRILVLNKGKVTEDGSHEQLMSLDGEYATSYKLQAEGYGGG